MGGKPSRAWQLGHQPLAGSGERGGRAVETEGVRPAPEPPGGSREDAGGRGGGGAEGRAAPRLRGPGLGGGAVTYGRPLPRSRPLPAPPALPGPRPGPRPPFLAALRPRVPPARLAMAVPGLLPAKGYRVVLLGSVAVGKTALATQFACGSFPEQCEPSVEELFSKVIEVNAAPALLEIVDTVGAEHLVTLKDLYIKNSDGFVVLYSVCSEASFEAVRPLRERMGRLRGPKAVPLVLVGTKADLDAERQVLTARGRALAREWRCPFLEVTAKSKLMVDQVFTQVVREMEALAPPEQEVRAAPTHAQDTWPSERFIG
ncbi:ras-related protein Rap-2c-like [Rousettus aegyptiacus]|uniref:ras-related protein Rap-2c-like n=1 Tax=Rousettus aegyptiacus TaxID=9407 RepID=UPI00168CE9BE|nr:ras-related protein Rap-2c-like [Rousettus aegyptiacus]